jgi:hypothetical protein
MHIHHGLQNSREKLFFVQYGRLFFFCQESLESYTDCAICYNRSGNSSSQAAWSARPAPSWPVHHLIASRLRFSLRLSSFA